MLYPQYGDIFYFRVILRQRPVHDEKDAYTHNGQRYASLQACAKAAGYLEDENEAEQVFNEAAVSGTFSPGGLRALFATLTMEGYPTLHILNEHNVEMMTDDFHDDVNEKMRKLLVDFKKKLATHQKTLEQYQLHKHYQTGAVVNLNALTELEEVRQRITNENAQAEYDQLELRYPNNPLQEEFMVEFKVISPLPYTYFSSYLTTLFPHFSVGYVS